MTVEWFQCLGDCTPIYWWRVTLLVIFCSTPVLTSGLTTDWEPWTVSTTAPHQVPGWNPSVTRMCRYQKNPPPPKQLQYIRTRRDPTDSSSDALVLWSIWQSRNENVGLLAPISVTFPSAFTVRWLGKTGKARKSWTKAGGRMPQDPIASLQSLLLKKTI